MMYILLIFIVILITATIIVGFEFMIKDYTEQEKKDAWENFYRQLNDKDLFK